MKSIKKLRDVFTSHKFREKQHGSPSSQDPKQSVEESHEMQELRELRKQYEGLFDASSLVSSRAGDFSAAIQQLATYLITTFGSKEDGEMSKVFKIVGRVQFEMSKILDLYVNLNPDIIIGLLFALQVAQTLMDPTESLLSELQNVEDSKHQHDEKRLLYDQLRTRALKGRPKNGKGEPLADQQLQVVKEEFDKLSMFVNNRLVSLEQGRPRSLITQAARHHTAQMQLFSRGHSSLQSVEPYMRQVARERNIDRVLTVQSNGLHYPDDETNSNGDDVSYIDELETSDSQSLDQSNRYDSRIHTPERSPNTQDEEEDVPKNLSKEWNSLLTKLGRTSGENPHLRDVDLSGSVRSQSPKKELGRLSTYQGYHNSKSAPLTPRGLPVDADDDFQATELPEGSELNQDSYSSSPPSRQAPEVPAGSTRGYEGAGFSTTSSEFLSPSVSTSGRTSLDNHYHTSDVDLSTSGIQSDSSGMSSKFSQQSGYSSEAVPAKSPALDQKLPGPMPLGKPPVLSFVSPSLSSTPVGFTSNTMDSRRRDLKRYSQSGPLTFNGMPWSSQPSLGNMAPSTTQSTGSSDNHRSGPLGRSPLGRTFGSPRISPCISPPRMSPPRISELHKLPPPPLNPTSKSSSRSPPSIITHSAPLSRYQDPLASSSVHATPLPPPPLGSMPRSLSMPARQKQLRSKLPSFPQVVEVSDEESVSPSHGTPNESSHSQAVPNGRNFTSQAQNKSSAAPWTRSASSQESGLPLSDLKFVHFDSARSASGASTTSSHQSIRPPSPSSLSRRDKVQLFEHTGHISPRFQIPSKSTPPMKSSSPRTSRWRSLSINDSDSYLQNAARGAVSKREFSPELVSLSPN